MASKHDPNRFTAAEVEAQKDAALRLFMGNQTQEHIAAELTTSLGDGRTVSRMTAARRVKAAIDDMRPHDDWQAYRTRQLAELKVSRQQVMTAITTWTGESGTTELCGPLNALIRLQERESVLVGLDRVDPTLAVRDDSARNYVLNIVTNPVKHQAMMAAMRSIESDVDGDYGSLTD